MNSNHSSSGDHGGESRSKHDHHPEHGEHHDAEHGRHHRGGEHHPHEHRYRIRIDKTIYEINNPTPTGRELLELAGKTPPDRFAIYEKLKHGPPKRIPLNERVDLRSPGVEHFVTLPLDQTEGLGERLHFELPEEDREWLSICGFRHELVKEGNVLRVVLYGFPVPSGYNVHQVDLNVRIDPGYPESQIDMVYFNPPLARTDGRPIRALAEDNFDGKAWQRWSRHRTVTNAWRPGLDCLMTHVALVQHWLESELTKA